MNAMLSLLAALLIIGYPGPIYGENDNEASVVIDGVRVTLGMPEGDVLAKLRKEHQMQRTTSVEGKTTGSWVVVSRESHDRGLVSFEQGKLVQAGATWASVKDQAVVDFARAVIGVLSTVAAQPSASCAVSVDTIELQRIEGRSATLNCGPKSVIISVEVGRDGKAATAASVREHVGAVSE